MVEAAGAREATSSSAASERTTCATNAGCSSGVSTPVTKTTSARSPIRRRPAAMPSQRPAAVARVLGELDLAAAAAAAPGRRARTTTTGPSTARATMPAARRTSVEPCHSSAPSGVPMRVERPPASTMPAVARVRHRARPRSASSARWSKSQKRASSTPACVAHGLGRGGDRDRRRRCERVAVDAGRDRRQRDPRGSRARRRARSPGGSTRRAARARPRSPPRHTGPTAWMTWRALQPPAGRDLRVAGVAAAEQAALLEQLAAPPRGGSRRRRRHRRAGSSSRR